MSVKVASMPDAPNSNGTNDKFLRKKFILSQLPIHENTLWTWVRDGRFPKPLILNPGAKRELVAWRESDYLSWRDSLPQRVATPTTPAGRGRPRKQMVTRPGE